MLELLSPRDGLAPGAADHVKTARRLHLLGRTVPGASVQVAGSQVPGGHRVRHRRVRARRHHAGAGHRTSLLVQATLPDGSRWNARWTSNV
jgi:hypothetical protein